MESGGYTVLGGFGNRNFENILLGAFRISNMFHVRILVTVAATKPH